MISLDSYNDSDYCVRADSRRNEEKLKIFNHDGCAVCLEDTTDIMLLPCAHTFHGDCILLWVKQNFSCPTCRANVGQFVPLKGEISGEFTELWNQHYMEAPAVKEEPDRDNELKKEQVVEEKKPLVIDLDEFESLLDQTDASLEDKMEAEVEDKMEVEQETFTLDMLRQESGYTKQAETTMLTRALIDASVETAFNPVDLLRRRIFTRTNILVEGIVQKPENVKPTYETFDNLRGGACSGVLTTIGRLLVERQPLRNIYPVLREVGPNVAIYFTTYEQTKKHLGRESDSYMDIWKQCFVSGCVGGFFAYLPRTHFTALVPLQFGIHFGVFEMAKQAIRNNTDRQRLNVGDVASTAILGGILGSCLTFPLSQMCSNVQLALEGQSVSLTQNIRGKFLGHISRMSPLWATTACGFEFSRRLITNT